MSERHVCVCDFCGKEKPIGEILPKEFYNWVEIRAFVYSWTGKSKLDFCSKECLTNYLLKKEN